ncbi:MAG TPA: cupin domain-containing protein [Allosphingosinicella sp.]|jgi:uncharacterized cupin superfamily protein
MPKIDVDAIAQTNRTGYPAPFDREMQERRYRRLAPTSGLTAFGASHVVLKPGAWSSQRHWHQGEDEFLVLIAGEGVLVDDDGEHVLRPGDCAAFPMNDGNGHHVQNRSDTDCVFIVVGAGKSEGGDYPDIDMCFTPEGTYVHKDGTPYDARRA